MQQTRQALRRYIQVNNIKNLRWLSIPEASSYTLCPYRKSHTYQTVFYEANHQINHTAANHQ